MKFVFAVVTTMFLAGSAYAQTYTKTETIEYHDDTAQWILGQVKRTTVNGTEATKTDYGWMSLPWKKYDFGKLQQQFGYDNTSTIASGQLGTLKQVIDGRANTTTLISWRRGIPGKVTHPATTDQPTAVFQEAAINDDGTIASVTDENGYKTCYGYDPMGRLNKITYPSETTLRVCDGTAWNPTTITFAGGNPTAYGMPAGHWRQTTLTGRGRKIIIYDALWRPVVEQALDLDRVSTTTSEIIKRYDAAGRLAFQSYPMNTVGAANYTDTTLKGSQYTYDALDRPTKVEQDWEGAGKLTTTTEYLTGFQTRVTNPRGKQTLTTLYQAFDQPTYEFPRGINHPTDATTTASFTEIARDIFGKPTSIKRRNAAGTLAATRSYTYNANQELCRTDEPETGSSVMGFDAAGNLSWSASGNTFTAAGCAAGATVAARRVDRTYDARNRLKTLTFPDGQGNTTSVWAPDGLLASITADNGNGQIVTTSYTHNRRRLLELERMQWGSINWPVDYAYNTNGHLASQTFSGLLTDFAPDALGRPTKAGTSARGVSYHPNGAIKQFTYGNDITHTLTQNTRQLPDTSCDSYGACGASSVLNDNYDYDPNGNVLAISDGRTGNDGDRDMVYDALDRLTSTVSPPELFGTATYTYDVLDNLTRTSVTGGSAVRNYYYCYDAAWRLDFIRNGAVCTGSTPSTPLLSLDYDPQGNLSARVVAAQSSQNRGFSFDLGNRLRSTTGLGASAYVYDGHGRRVRDFTTASKYSLYSNSGQLVFDSDGRTGLQHWYVYLQGSLVEVRERNTTTGVYTTKYQHTDALGSPVAVTDASRAVLARYEYEPYGMGGPADAPGYTGHVKDAATGLNYMQQRYYDPGIGRFLSVDPVSAYEKPLTNFNRYFYARDNPYKFTDPDGRESSCFANGNPSCGVDLSNVPVNLMNAVEALVSMVTCLGCDVDYEAPKGSGAVEPVITPIETAGAAGAAKIGRAIASDPKALVLSWSMITGEGDVAEALAAAAARKEAAEQTAQAAAKTPAGSLPPPPKPPAPKPQAPSPPELQKPTPKSSDGRS